MKDGKFHSNIKEIDPNGPRPIAPPPAPKGLSPKRPHRIKVFISGPYTIGDVGVNVSKHVEMLDQLMTLGFAPFAPLLFHYAQPRPYKDWIEIDLDYLDVCDVILRMPGESSGADNEVAYARSIGLPVVFSIEELLKLYPNAKRG